MQDNTPSVHATHQHTCGHCGSADIQDQLEWPVSPLGAPQSFDVICPSCGNTVVIDTKDGEWVSDKLIHQGAAG